MPRGAGRIRAGVVLSTLKPGPLQFQFAAIGVQLNVE